MEWSRTIDRITESRGLKPICVWLKFKDKKKQTLWLIFLGLYKYCFLLCKTAEPMAGQCEKLGQASGDHDF